MASVHVVPVILDLLELVVPGVGPVFTALEQICRVVDEMDELSLMCKHAYERLALIYDRLRVLEKKRRLPLESVLSLYTSLVGGFKIVLEKHRGKKWIYRVVTYKRVISKLKDFQERTSTLMIMLHMSQIDAMEEERARMKELWMQQVRGIEDCLTNDATIAREVASEADQVEALSVFRYELADSADHRQKIVKRALEKVMRRSTVVVSSVPDWFLPKHKVEYKPQAFARGSFGTVHYGQMDFVDVIVKCLLVDMRGNKIITDKFCKEAGLWFKFRHKHMLTMYGACDVSSPPFIVYEHATNGNLFNFLSDENNQPFTFQLLHEVASGLAYLHQNRVVHGDLKCDSILVAADRSAKIADFSFSYVSDVALSKERFGEKAGALRWRASECLVGCSPTRASDVFSLGMCIVEAVSLEIPWGYYVDDDTVRDLVKSGTMLERPERMNNRAWKLVERMCSFEPEQRPSLEYVLCELGELAAHEAAVRASVPVVGGSSTATKPRGTTGRARADVKSLTNRFVNVAPRASQGRNRGTPRARGANKMQVKEKRPELIEAQQLKPIEVAQPKSIEAEQPKSLELKHPKPDPARSAPALAEAIAHDDVESVTRFISSAELLGSSIDGATLLVRAAAAGATKVIQLLLSRGAELDGTTCETALFVAASFGKLGCVRALIKNKTNVHAKRSVDGDTALHIAAFEGHVDVIGKLLQNGAHVDASNGIGQTPLMLAAANGQTKAVRLLLNRKADVRAKNAYGATALHQATIYDSGDLVKELIRYGARTSATDINDNTPLHWAVRGNKIESVHTLLQHEANVHAKNKRGETPLHRAATAGSVAIVLMLLRAGAKVETSTVEHAKKTNRVEVVALLERRWRY